MVSPKAYGTQEILHDIAAIRGQLANLQQNGNFNNMNVAGLATFSGQMLATGGTPATPTNIETDNWTNVSAPTNMTGTVRFKLFGFSAVGVNVEVVPNSSSASGGFLLFNMPSIAYVPAIQQRGSIAFVSNGTPTGVAQLNAMCGMRWQANPNGTFNVLNYVGGAAGSGVIEMSFNCIYFTDQ